MEKYCEKRINNNIYLLNLYELKSTKKKKSADDKYLQQPSYEK